MKWIKMGLFTIAILFTSQKILADVTIRQAMDIVRKFIGKPKLSLEYTGIKEVYSSTCYEFSGKCDGRMFTCRVHTKSGEIWWYVEYIGTHTSEWEKVMRKRKWISEEEAFNLALKWLTEKGLLKEDMEHNKIMKSIDMWGTTTFRWMRTCKVNGIKAYIADDYIEVGVSRVVGKVIEFNRIPLTYELNLKELGSLGSKVKILEEEAIKIAEKYISSHKVLVHYDVPLPVHYDEMFEQEECSIKISKMITCFAGIGKYDDNIKLEWIIIFKGKGWSNELKSFPVTVIAGVDSFTGKCKAIGIKGDIEQKL